MLFRNHFKYTIQSFTMLANVANNTNPYTDKQKVNMPPLVD